ncbi:hypothetical protein AUR64_12735 [Haloprofundus marisrubri]|uniref:Uncharacterized protein n=1 Tax=Haloprofundus marisrubri TaxID=1514971 RepID=A0A0W1RAI5_9EURY|nr:DUF5799 family protein [Haloprofundus marisrubri]KTG10424.1 hypothetical protein AUR64_12735 [Haloprofundus marisrubri]
MQNWTDSIVGERMTVDREFNQRIRDSAFTSQEWGLIMTATEFEIENADDAENARIVANTEKVPQILPELENVRSQMQSMGGAPERGNRGGGGGIVDSIKGALGIGGGDSGGVNQDELERAERLTQEYADELQSHLEQKGKWQQVRVAYQE